MPDVIEEDRDMGLRLRGKHAESIRIEYHLDRGDRDFFISASNESPIQYVTYLSSQEELYQR